jgi:hypothetical protein
VGFDLTKQTADISCIRHRNRKWEQSKTIHRLFIDVRKACNRIKSEILCKYVIEVEVPVNLYYAN